LYNKNKSDINIIIDYFIKTMYKIKKNYNIIGTCRLMYILQFNNKKKIFTWYYNKCIIIKKIKIRIPDLCIFYIFYN